MTFLILIALSLLVSPMYANAILDFCVGDPSLPQGPTGYACKDRAKVTADDFVYTGFRVRANTSSLFKAGKIEALVDQFPGLNGLGMSMLRVDVDVGGAVPMHWHRVSEIILVIEGTVIAGFIDSNNTSYYKKLYKGDIMVIPPMLQHFQVNIGTTPALTYTSFPSSNPGIQTLSKALFEGDIPTEVVEKTTLMDRAEVKKLKKAFGGTN